MNTRLCGTCKAYQAGTATRPPPLPAGTLTTLTGTCRRISPSRFGFPGVSDTEDWCLEWEKDSEKTCPGADGARGVCVLPAGHEGGCIDKNGDGLEPSEEK